MDTKPTRVLGYVEGLGIVHGRFLWRAAVEPLRSSANVRSVDAESGLMCVWALGHVNAQLSGNANYGRNMQSAKICMM